MMTLESIVRWCLKNRKSNAFYRWDESQIAQSIYEAYSDKSIMVISDTNGSLIGLVMWKEQPSKLLYIYQIITTQPGVLKQFVQAFRVKFPGYGLTAIRHISKVRTYRTERLVKLIDKIT